MREVGGEGAEWGEACMDLRVTWVGERIYIVTLILTTQNIKIYTNTRVN